MNRERAIKALLAHGVLCDECYWDDEITEDNPCSYCEKNLGEYVDILIKCNLLMVDFPEPNTPDGQWKTSSWGDDFRILKIDEDGDVPVHMSRNEGDFTVMHLNKETVLAIIAAHHHRRGE